MNPMHKITLGFVAITLTTGLLVSNVCHASIIQPEVGTDLYGSVNTSQSSPGYASTNIVRIGRSGDASGTWQGYVQYTIPTYAGQVIEKVEINMTNIVNETGPTTAPGIRILIVTPDFTLGDVAFDYGTELLPQINLRGSGSTTQNLKVDITAFFDGTIASVKQGDTMSLRVYHVGGGNRRAGTSDDITLTITTIPEPGSLVLLGASSALIALRRRVS